jgi:hypothetical protein
MSRCPTPSKQPHPTCDAAVRHIKALQHKDGALDVRPYRCRCGAWHVGHSQPALRKRIRQALRRTG